MMTSDASADFQTATASRQSVIDDIKTWLGLPQLAVIRGGWTFPETFEAARKAHYDENTNSWYGGKAEEPYYKRVKKEYEEQLALASDSLRSFIAQQDAETAAKLTEGDLHSLLRLGHTTVQGSGRQPVAGVVVFDPADSGAAVDSDWMLGRIFSEKTLDSWSREAGKKPPELPLGNFIENLDIKPLDYYAYEVLQRVHYALKHQHQLAAMDQRWDERFDTPQYLSFARLQPYTRPAEFTPYAKQEEGSSQEKTAAENDVCRYFDRYRYDKENAQKPLGNDPQFADKLRLLTAVECVFPMLAGSDAKEDTLRRIAGEFGQGSSGWSGVFKGSEELTPKKQHEISSEIMAKQCDLSLEHLPHEPDSLWRMMDARIEIPLFRKLYAAEESKENKDLATIMFLRQVNEGLQKYFPTLLNAPLPDLNPEAKPPTTLEGYKNRPIAPQAAPGPKLR